MLESDEMHEARALLASRFVEADAAELARMTVREVGVIEAQKVVEAYRRSRDAFATKAAACELAACVVTEAMMHT